MSKFNKGDHVKVVSGPWKGYHGSVSIPKTAAGKVEVAISKGGGHIQMSFFAEDELAANSVCTANDIVRNALEWKAKNSTNDSEAVQNAATDSEFEKIKAMGKAAGEKYFSDNYQSFIDKYGIKDALELGKRISRIKYKPIKKGRFSGKGPDGMTYYVDYTNDMWFAKKYGKDGTNVTEIQVQGPFVKDADGKERRHILYLYGSGSESIRPANPAVAQLVKQIMRGPDVIDQDATDYAWNSDMASTNPIVANAISWRAKNATVVNAVRGNTKLKSIDFWFADNGYGDDTLVKYVAGYKKNRAVDFVDRYADTAARDAFYDAMYQLTGIKSKWALNAQRKAMNAIHFGVGNKVMHRDSKMRGTIVGRYNDFLWNVKWDAGFIEPASSDDLVFISMR